MLILQPAAAENLVSRPVGFVRIAVPSNTQVLASQPFFSAGASNDGAVLRWNSASGYTSSGTAEPGEGFWLVNNQTTSQIVFLTGEVALSPSNTALLYPGLNLVGYPYSSPLPLNETALGALTDRVDILNARAEAPSGDEAVLGKGYWVKSLSEECIVWTEIRPYENVFPESGLPDIRAVSAKDGSCVALSIDCEGAAGLDVFYQDLTPTSRFDTAGNWQLAETKLSATGLSQLEWVDSGSKNRAAPGEILGRYYLVGRADIDLNGNGVPDAREAFVNGDRTALVTRDSLVLEPGSGVLAQPPELVLSATSNDYCGVSNREPAQVVSVGRIIYVDQRTGSDAFSGLAKLRSGSDGPKKTIGGGLTACGNGGVVVIQDGQYGESLCAAGRSITVQADGCVDLRGKVQTSEPAISNTHTNR